MQLHKPDVVAAAATILDDYGIADLSMRRLARELNVSPSALYWHFANKQQLLGALADRVLAPACADPGPGSWRWRIRTVCARLRDALLSHTDGAELVSASLAAGQSQAVADILALLADAATAAGCTRIRPCRWGAPSCTTCWDSPPTSSPGCSGTPPVRPRSHPTPTRAAPSSSGWHY